jgi:hypothetical protein
MATFLRRENDVRSRPTDRYDNLKSAVPHRAGNTVRFNPHFLPPIRPDGRDSGGTVSVDSVIGSGTTFVVRLLQTHRDGRTRPIHEDVRFDGAHISREVEDGEGRVMNPLGDARHAECRP